MKIVGLFRYPVKSLRGQALDETLVEPIGLAGDRRWLVVDENDAFVTARQTPKLLQVAAEQTGDGGLVLRHADEGEIVVALPVAGERRMVTVWGDTVPARAAAPEAGAFLSRAAGRPLLLFHMDEPGCRPVRPGFSRPGDHVSFADAYPLLVTTTASLEDLNRRAPFALEMARFRPNIVIETREAWVEDTWRRLRIGGMTLRIAEPCGRCILTSRDPLSGEQRDKREPLKTLATFRRGASGEVMFGQNAIPNGLGAIRLGDAVEVLESGPSNLYP